MRIDHLNNLCVQVLYQNFWFFVPMPLFVAMSMLSAMPLMTTGDHLLKVVDFIGIVQVQVQVHVHVQLQVAGRVLTVRALYGLLCIRIDTEHVHIVLESVVRGIDQCGIRATMMALVLPLPPAVLIVAARALGRCHGCGGGHRGGPEGFARPLLRLRCAAAAGGGHTGARRR
uniref:IP16874p n=1 Tax=Drosophila melanogaster TaxID=7227 RepID=A1A6P7_DROME|nr:IP16874p [Drosophila melanogaster]